MPHVVDIDRRLTMLRVVARATPLEQLLLFLVLIMAAAAVAAWAGQLVRGGVTSTRADHVLSAVVVAAPLVGLTDGAQRVAVMFIAAANLFPTPSLEALFPSMALVAICILSGMSAGALAAVLRAHIRVATAPLSLA